jgi:hypothetical protein
MRDETSDLRPPERGTDKRDRMIGIVGLGQELAHTAYVVRADIAGCQDDR